MSGGQPGPGGRPGKRGEVRGWTMAQARRNERWLQRVEVPPLLGLVGIAITNTIRECPEDAAVWAALRRAFLMRQIRRGAICWHWVTEWQRRGVPHNHSAIFFPDRGYPAECHYEVPRHGRPGALMRRVGADAHNRGERAKRDWCEVAAEYGAQRPAQWTDEINGVVGWLQYLAKHSARGVHHYQRAEGVMPAGWERSGRLWGHGGDWSLSDDRPFGVTRDVLVRVARVARGHARSEARGRRDWQALRYARRRSTRLRRDGRTGEAIPAPLLLPTHWIGEADALRLLAHFGAVDMETGEVLGGFYRKQGRQGI